jgi:hypothetical protein
MLASYSAVSFAQGTTAPLKPLSVGTVTLYYNEFFFDRIYTYRSNGHYLTQVFSGEGRGYFFSKVIGDTIIEGKKYAIVHTSEKYANTNKAQYVLQYNEIVYERLTDSALYQFTPGFDYRTGQTDFEKEVFNIKSKQCNDFVCNYQGSSFCSTQENADTLTISCYSHSPDICETLASIRNGLGIVVSTELSHSSSPSLEAYYHSTKRFIGAISNGKVLGDSLVLYLDTDRNTLDTLGRHELFNAGLDNNALKIYPYLTQNVLSLRLNTTTDQNITIEMFSVLGQLVQKFDSLQVKKPNPQVDLNIGYLTPGLYFIRVYSKEGVSTSKILISN